MDIKTVDDSDNRITDSLYQRQKENVSKMRASLLSCTDESGVSTRHAIQSITTMRIYHQLTRIIRYLELMDKLEVKLYESIEYSIETANKAEPTTWMALLTIQEKLQKTMIESHKLLQPYLDIQEFSVVDLTTSDGEVSNHTQIMNPEDRDRLRSTAQTVLQQLQSTGGANNGP